LAEIPKVNEKRSSAYGTHITRVGRCDTYIEGILKAQQSQARAGQERGKQGKGKEGDDGVSIRFNASQQPAYEDERTNHRSA
jgi:hypothetical protein